MLTPNRSIDACSWKSPTTYCESPRTVTYLRSPLGLALSCVPVDTEAPLLVADISTSGPRALA